MKVLDDHTWNSLQRDLDVVELWSGTETIVRAAVKRGLVAQPFDKCRSEEDEDITSPMLASNVMCCLYATPH